MKLRDVCELINGRAYSKPELLSEGKYPVLRVGNFFTNNNWYHSDMELGPEKYCDTGDLLYAWSASFGPRIWEGGKVIYHYHIWKVQPAQEMIDKKFLFLWFLWDTDEIKKDQGAGTTMLHVSKGSMEDRDITVPPLPEQQRIVGVLDEAFAGIATAQANAEKNLQNARALFESHLQSVFTQRGKGWVETTLDDEVEFAAGYAFKSSGYVKGENGTRLLRGDNIMQGEFRWDEAAYWPSEDTPTYDRFRLEENDIVLAMDRPWVAAGLKIACVSKTDIPCLQVQRTARLRVSNRLSWRYLFHLLRGQGFVSYLLDGQTGLGVPHISGKQILSFQFSRPSLAEQDRIANKLDALANETQILESIYRQKLAALVALKKSLLHQAFSGQL